MNLTKIPVLASGVLLLVGCNRPMTDQGGTGASSTSEADRGGGASAPMATTVNTNTHTNIASAITNHNADVPATARPADNTGRNVRDRSDAAVTPGDQSNAKADIDLTSRIRKAVNDNDQLSTNAKNIKIIDAGDGKVTLRGPVNSDAEKQTILQLVQAVTGVTSVDNQLEVAVKQ